MALDVRTFEALVTAGVALTRAQTEALLERPDLAGLGMLGEQARVATSGARVAFGRVLVVAGGPSVETVPPEAGEVRVVATPASVEEAVAMVSAVASRVQGPPLTGFSLTDLRDLAGGDCQALADVAARLREAGLEAIAEAPIDLLGETALAVDLIRSVVRGGLAVRRATVARADMAERLALIERAISVQRETSALQAFAPLPRFDPADLPATGYDDVRTIAAARLMARDIPFIQVDWPLYGPKLAQVAVTYGANDVDGIAAIDPLNLGVRRSPREEIERQIRAAGAVPAERDGRYTWRT